MQQSMVTTNFPTRLALALMLLLSMAACSTGRPSTSDTTINNSYSYDSIFCSNTRIDTIFRDRWHAEYHTDSIVYIRDSVLCYRYRAVHDTLFKYSVDTLEVVRSVVHVKEVARKRTWFDYTSYFTCILFVGYLIYKARSWL